MGPRGDEINLIQPGKIMDGVMLPMESNIQGKR
jgi:hypothetical protein